jgi:hypothetical protein
MSLAEFFSLSAEEAKSTTLTGLDERLALLAPAPTSKRVIQP